MPARPDDLDPRPDGARSGVEHTADAVQPPRRPAGVDRVIGGVGSDTLGAAALGYRRGVDAAPRVLARGRGEIAERIVDNAERHGIPIERDPDLLQSLAAVEVSDAIPTDAFVAVAEILAFLYRRNASLAEGRAAP